MDQIEVRVQRLRQRAQELGELQKQPARWTGHPAFPRGERRQANVQPPGQFALGEPELESVAADFVMNLRPEAAKSGRVLRSHADKIATRRKTEHGGG